MSFEHLPNLPFHLNNDLEGGQDGPSVPEAIPAPDLGNGGATAPEQEFSPLLPDLSKFDLTVVEALESFQLEDRKIPSTRTLQRYCQEGRIDCYKLKTTRNGNPVHEWIIDSTSLWEFIQSRPKDETRCAIATPEASDDADGDAETRSGGKQPASAKTAADWPGDANKHPALPKLSEREPDVTAAPVDADDARGGHLSRVDLLIENARLTAQLDAQCELVSEFREDKRFMREEIAQHRKNDRVLADMHRETLQTLKAVSVAGRHTKIELPGDHRPGEGSGMFRDVAGSEQDNSPFNNDGV